MRADPDVLTNEILAHIPKLRQKILGERDLTPIDLLGPAKVTTLPPEEL